MYNDLSKYYDIFDWRKYTYVQLDFFKTQIINNYDISSLLDIACGTGNFLNEIHHILPNTKLYGIDISDDMINIAKSKLVNAVLKVENMKCFSFDKSFDLITCFFDSLNYLSCEKEIETTFDNVYKHLSSGKIFAFDFIPKDAINIFTGNSLEKNEDISLKIESLPYENDKIITKINLIDKNTHIYEEHIEYLYNCEIILKLLKKSEFCDVKIFDNELNLIEKSGYKTANQNRVFVIAHKK